MKSMNRYCFSLKGTEMTFENLLRGLFRRRNKLVSKYIESFPHTLNTQCSRKEISRKESSRKEKGRWVEGRLERCQVDAPAAALQYRRVPKGLSHSATLGSSQRCKS